MGDVEGAKHLSRDLAGEGAALLGVHVLGAELDGLALEGVADALQRGEGGAEDDIDGRLAADLRQDFLGEGDAVGGGLVHLPVTGDEFLADGGHG